MHNLNELELVRQHNKEIIREVGRNRLAKILKAGRKRREHRMFYLLACRVSRWGVLLPRFSKTSKNAETRAKQ